MTSNSADQYHEHLWGGGRRDPCRMRSCPGSIVTLPCEPGTAIGLHSHCSDKDGKPQHKKTLVPGSGGGGHPCHSPRTAPVRLTPHPHLPASRSPRGARWSSAPGQAALNLAPGPAPPLAESTSQGERGGSCRWTPRTRGQGWGQLHPPPAPSRQLQLSP